MVKLTDKDKEFRTLVVELDGDLVSLGEVYGICFQSVSSRLRTRKHGAWWTKFKKERMLRRKRARYRRAEERAVERAKIAMGIE